jgi:hypothetical protein
VTRQYLWCRAWPWYLAAFSFERFDALDEPAIWDALRSYAQEWQQGHVGELVAARERQQHISDMRDRGQPTFPSPRQNSKSRGRPDPSRRATFDEVAIIAGWAQRPHGRVVKLEPFGFLQPYERVYFYRCEDAETADALLDALRAVHPSFKIGSGRALVRYGKRATTDLTKGERLLVARHFEDFWEGRSPTRDWARRFAEESVRLEELLRAEEAAEAAPATGSQVLKQKIVKLSPGEQAAHDSYEWVMSQHPELAAAEGRSYAKAYAYLTSAVERGQYEGYSSPKAMPRSATWQSYVRKGLRSEGSPKPEVGRDPGSSIVRQDDI